jgi:hypothetical protein
MLQITKYQELMPDPFDISETDFHLIHFTYDVDDAVKH